MFILTDFYVYTKIIKIITKAIAEATVQCPPLYGVKMMFKSHIL